MCRLHVPADPPRDERLQGPDRVTADGREQRTGREDSRTEELALGDRVAPLEDVGREVAGIEHGRHAGVEIALEVPRRVGETARPRPARRRIRPGVSVHVDQTRHEDPARPVDDPLPLGLHEILADDGLDPAILEDHVAGRHEKRTAAVEDEHVGDPGPRGRAGGLGDERWRCLLATRDSPNYGGQQDEDRPSKP